MALTSVPPQGPTPPAEPPLEKPSGLAKLLPILQRQRAVALEVANNPTFAVSARQDAAGRYELLCWVIDLAAALEAS